MPTSSTLTWNTYAEWLADALQSPLPQHVPAPAVSLWQSDSRSLQKGQWFVPLSGERFDGHHFIAEALQRGAAGFLYQKEQTARLTAQLGERLSQQGVAVQDPLAALQKIARGWRRCFSGLEVLALTGSVGKTTCKEMVRCILNPSQALLATAGNFNNEIGVSKTLLALEAQHRYALLEMGARKPGDIGVLVTLAEPSIVACLNAGISHLEIFGSKQALLQTKLEILTKAPTAHTGVVLHDDPRILNAAQRWAESQGKKLLSFGYDPQASIHIAEVSWQKDQSQLIRFNIQGSRYELSFGLGHEAYPINAAAAIGLALAAGLPVPTIITNLELFSGLSGRFRLLPTQAFTLIDDCYNASLDSMHSGLSSLARLFPKQQKIVILGDMLELGSESAYAHRQVGHLCQSLVAPSLLVTVGPQAQLIASQAHQEGLAPSQIVSYADVAAFLAAPPLLKADVVYVKGSHGVGLQKIIDYYYQP